MIQKNTLVKTDMPAPSFPKSITEIFSIYSNGINVMGWSLLKDLMYRIDVLLLPAFLSELDFGIYSVMQYLCN